MVLIIVAELTFIFDETVKKFHIFIIRKHIIYISHHTYYQERQRFPWPLAKNIGIFDATFTPILSNLSLAERHASITIESDLLIRT